MVDWLARRLRLSREGLFWLALCLAMLATGLFKSINLITLLACVLLAAVLCNWVLARRQIGRLKAIRELPDLVNVGDSIRWRIHVRPLDGRTRVGIRVDDPGSEGPLHWFVDRLPADGIVVDATIQPKCRGILTVKPVTIRSGHPLGLADMQVTIASADRLVVAPRLGTVHRARLRRWFARCCFGTGAVRTRPRRLPGAHTEFHGLRTYRPGDNPRAIHWPTSARKNVLMVRDFEEYPNDDLVLLVDLTLADPTRIEAFERMLSVAASVCREWCRQKGDRLTLLLAGTESEILHGATGLPLLVQAFRLLAAAQPGSFTESALAKLRGAARSPTAHLLLSVGPSRLPEAIRETLHSPIATVDVTAGEEMEFFDNIPEVLR